MSQQQTEQQQQHEEGWTHLCALPDAPEEGNVAEFESDGTAVCLARLRGELLAVDNLCPHRQGPMGQGWLEGDTVVCPWHSWAFNLHSGTSEYPPGQQIATFPVRLAGDEVLVQLPRLPTLIPED